MIFDTFGECASLRVIYRQGDPRPFKESTRHLRDPALTMADYGLWNSRDIAPAGWSGELKRRADPFLWICEEGASPGAGRSGNRRPLESRANANPSVRGCAQYAFWRKLHAWGNSGFFGVSATWRLEPPFSSLRIRSMAQKLYRYS